MKTVTIDVELTEEQAWQFAQLLKRIGFSDYRLFAENDEQAYEMKAAGGAVQDALARAGVNPR